MEVLLVANMLSFALSAFAVGIIVASKREIRRYKIACEDAASEALKSSKEAYDVTLGVREEVEIVRARVDDINQWRSLRGGK